MRIKSIISWSISIIIFAFAVFILTNVIIAKINNKPAIFFGYSMHIVVTDSMTGEIEVGDMVIAKQCPIESIKVGDNVLFYSQHLNNQIIVHKVINITGTNKDDIRLTTKGVKTGLAVDDAPVTIENFVGKSVTISTILGKIYLSFTSPLSLIALVAIIGMIVLICLQIKRISRISKQSKNEIQEK